jgi:hypothetical protein
MPSGGHCKGWASRRKTAQGLAPRARVVLLCAEGVVTWLVVTEPNDVSGGLAGLRKTAIEIPQTALESRYKVWGDRWLPFGVTARWLGARLVRLVDAECCIQQLVGIR